MMKKLNAILLMFLFLLPSLGYPQSPYKETEQKKITEYLYKKILLLNQAYDYKTQGKVKNVPDELMVKATLDSSLWANISKGGFESIFEKVNGYDYFISSMTRCVLDRSLKGVNDIFLSTLKTQTFKVDFKPYYDAILKGQNPSDKNFFNLFYIYNKYKSQFWLYPSNCVPKSLMRQQEDRIVNDFLDDLRQARIYTNDILIYTNDIEREIDRMPRFDDNEAYRAKDRARDAVRSITMNARNILRSISQMMGSVSDLNSLNDYRVSREVSSTLVNVREMSFKVSDLTQELNRLTPHYNFDYSLKNSHKQVVDNARALSYTIDDLNQNKSYDPMSIMRNYPLAKGVSYLKPYDK